MMDFHSHSHAISLPDMEPRSRQQQPFAYPPPSSHSTPYTTPYDQHLAQHHPHPSPFDQNALIPTYAAPHSHHHSHSFTEPDDSDFSHLDEAQIAAALASYEPCNDCTSTTHTRIPHHHHPSGRLAGASATLDGHYCCSWLVHEQPCFLCFESAEALDNHIKTDHAGKDGTYRCLWQSCSKHNPTTQTAGPMNFGNKPKLMRHVHSHTGYKPFPCLYPGCGKGFVTKEQLKNHETTHTKARKYACPHCEKAFAVKSALTTHITAVHEERKTHRCDVCGKAFADSSNLSKHKQTHYRPHPVTSEGTSRRHGSSSNSSNTAGVKKKRSRRATSSATSTRSTPSLPTPTVEPATPAFHGGSLAQDFSSLPPIHPGLMAPPALPKPSTEPYLLGGIPLMTPYTDVANFPTTAISSSPSGENPGSDDFDASCYCCEQRCTPPNGPATPCDEPTEACDKDGFCDLPDCTPCCSDDADHCDKEGFCDLPDCFVGSPPPGFRDGEVATAAQWEDFFASGIGTAAEIPDPIRPLTHVQVDLERPLAEIPGS